jgi:hypothetical protein
MTVRRIRGEEICLVGNSGDSRTGPLRSVYYWGRLQSYGEYIPAVIADDDREGANKRADENEKGKG